MRQERLPILLTNALADCSSVLDVGCGDNSWLRYVSGKRLTGLDAHVPSIERAREQRTHDEFVVGQATDLDRLFQPSAFDAVVMLDLIEHFEKEAGLQLINTAAKIARKKLVVFTPSGFQPQPPTDDNPWQQHRSGWTAEELESLGFHVIGTNGWKPLRGPFAAFRRPAFLSSRVSALSESLVQEHPRHAYALFAVKDLAHMP